MLGRFAALALIAGAHMDASAGVSIPAPFVGTDLNGTPCVGNATGYGPYDYTNPAHRGQNLFLVESAHFTPEIEQLIRGKHAVSIEGDLEYTLRAFPNHHRALYTAIRYHISGSASKNFPLPECWLNRARHFAPQDSKLLLLEGLYLHQKRRYQAAMEKYREAETRIQYKGELHYNMGLLSLDIGEPAAARKFADQARAAGYGLEGLNQKLKRLGY